MVPRISADALARQTAARHRNGQYGTQHHTPPVHYTSLTPTQRADAHDSAQSAFVWGVYGDHAAGTLPDTALTPDGRAQLRAHVDAFTERAAPLLAEAHARGVEPAQIGHAYVLSSLDLPGGFVDLPQLRDDRLGQQLAEAARDGLPHAWEATYDGKLHIHPPTPTGELVNPSPEPSVNGLIPRTHPAPTHPR